MLFCCQVVFYCCVKIEKVYGKNVGIVVNLVGYYLMIVESDIVVQYFIFNGGVDVRQQFVNRVEMGMVFVMQREVEQEVLYGMQVNFCQFIVLCCVDVCQGIEWNSV